MSVSCLSDDNMETSSPSCLSLGIHVLGIVILIFITFVMEPLESLEVKA